MIVFVIRIKSVSGQRLKLVFELKSFVIERKYLVDLLDLVKITAFIFI